MGKESTNQKITQRFIRIVSETNGIALGPTLELLIHDLAASGSEQEKQVVEDFFKKLKLFGIHETNINDLLNHPFYESLFTFFKKFPLRYREEHIHLTGSLAPEIIFPYIEDLLNGPHKKVYEDKIKEHYGDEALPISSEKDILNLISISDTDGFDEYLKVLYLPKLILTSRDIHRDLAYSMAKDLYERFNVGHIRLKFTFDRSSSSEALPGVANITSEDVILGLYDGYKKFQGENSDFSFILSPSFRKEADFFDSESYQTKKDHFNEQINSLVQILDKNPFLKDVLQDVDTVGNEKGHFSKSHFYEMQEGFRKLQYRGFNIRSHHGETFRTLNRGVQAVDNAMNIWHIDTLEHGLSLGINPNYYFHRMFQKALELNENGIPIIPNSLLANEVNELKWGKNKDVKDKLLANKKLTKEEIIYFLKTKFHTAREVEHYQHDVLNRLIQKGVSLVSLPSSNQKLTGMVEDFQDHPFSWWEKKGVDLAVGTDNYITLKTNFINEMIILLLTDYMNLKITKLLMVTTGEKRRPYLSHLLWTMRKSKSLS